MADQASPEIGARESPEYRSPLGAGWMAAGAIRADAFVVVAPRLVARSHAAEPRVWAATRADVLAEQELVAEEQPCVAARSCEER